MISSAIVQKDLGPLIFRHPGSYRRTIEAHAPGRQTGQRHGEAIDRHSSRAAAVEPASKDGRQAREALSVTDS